MGKNIAIIPARGGSVGIPRKNIMDLCGKPLIRWTIDAAIGSGIMDRVVVSTDDREIGEYCADTGKCFVVERPGELAHGSVHAIHAIMHAINFIEANDDDVVYMLLPTSPLRNASDIVRAGNIMDAHLNNKSVLGVTVFDGRFIRQKKLTNTSRILHPAHYQQDTGYLPQRQEVAGKNYYVNGALFASSIRRFRTNRTFHTDALPLIMPPYRSVDIDSLDDMYHAELIIKGLHK